MGYWGDGVGRQTRRDGMCTGSLGRLKVDVC